MFLTLIAFLIVKQVVTNQQILIENKLEEISLNQCLTELISKNFPENLHVTVILPKLNAEINQVATELLSTIYLSQIRLVEIKSSNKEAQTFLRYIMTKEIRQNFIIFLDDDPEDDLNVDIYYWNPYSVRFIAVTLENNISLKKIDKIFNFLSKKFINNVILLTKNEINGDVFNIYNQKQNYKNCIVQSKTTRLLETCTFGNFSRNVKLFKARRHISKQQLKNCTIRAGVFVAPPYVKKYKNWNTIPLKQRFYGLEINLLKLITKKLNYKIQYVEHDIMGDVLSNFSTTGNFDNLLTDKVDIIIGVRNANSYKWVRIKKVRLEGASYVNSVGNEVPARQYGGDCRCRWKCTDKFTDDQKTSLIENFSKLSSKDAQDVYLQSRVKLEPVKRQRSRKNVFVRLFGITEKRLRHLTSLLQQGNIPKDMRGQQDNRYKMPESDCQEIRAHINKFPTKTARYSNSEVKYLSAELTIKAMYELFKEEHPDSRVSYFYYQKFFRQHFDLKFGRPQKDTCSKCEELITKKNSNELNPHAKRVAEAELEVHKRRSRKFYSKMKSMESLGRDDIAGISMDFMQNLPLPHIPVQEVFYYRQLWVNVFNIHHISAGNSMYYVYHEGQAKKGPDEVRHLHLFSDACGGQNRNHTLLRFLCALVQTKRFETINYYTPIRGHSFMPNDRNFGTLKRRIKRLDRVYVPKQ
ncbi:unnamed protein product [Psylliodes chrysocephalus]|uniref:Uncharacterized protein n=1 Tax=Psylliodes chrysocephalus TaxID=3402493 RepID=A0A9P0D5S5_9CUCU|nr:unnamed protein product [Psylliodes chrysocephala]